MNGKQFIPIALIAGIALVVYKKAAGASTQIINRGIDFTQVKQSPSNQDANRLSAFGQLVSFASGSQKVSQQKDLAVQQLEAEKVRAQSAFELQKARLANSLDLGSQNLQRLTSANNLALEQTKLAVESRNFDRAAQQSAINRQLDLQNQIANRSANNNTLNSILGALSRVLSGQQSSRGSSGGSLPGTPPFNPNTQSRNQQVNNQRRTSAINRVYDWLNSQYSAGPLDYYPSDYFSDFGLDTGAYDFGAVFGDYGSFGNEFGGDGIGSLTGVTFDDDFPADFFEGD